MKSHTESGCKTWTDGGELPLEEANLDVAAQRKLPYLVCLNLTNGIAKLTSNVRKVLHFFRSIVTGNVSEKLHNMFHFNVVLLTCLVLWIYTT
jgi:hypothetical protein